MDNLFLFLDVCSNFYMRPRIPPLNRCKILFYRDGFDNYDSTLNIAV